MHLLNRLKEKRERERGRENTSPKLPSCGFLGEDCPKQPKHLNDMTKEKVRSPSFAMNSFDKLEMIRETSAMIFPILLRPYENGVFYPSSTSSTLSDLSERNFASLESLEALETETP